MVIGHGAGLGQRTRQGAGLERAVAGPLVVPGGGEGAVPADEDDQDRQRQGAERPPLSVRSLWLLHAVRSAPSMYLSTKQVGS